MSTRERPPQPQRSRHITPEGAKKLRAELDQLWTKERPRVTQEVADAAAQGDRSENAEYIYGKRRLREIDRRLRFLQPPVPESCPSGPAVALPFRSRSASSHPGRSPSRCPAI